MSAPKIKLYLLPPGYTQDGDDDVREAVDNELLPCVVKQEALNSVLAMTGVMPAFSKDCIKIDISGGLVTDSVDPVTGHLAVTSPSGIALPSGAYSPVLLDDTFTPIPASGWRLHQTNTGAFDHIEFLGTPPVSPTLRFYKIATPSGVSLWALPADHPYSGPNDSLSRVVIVGKYCTDATKEGVSLLGNTYLTGANNGLIQLPFSCSQLKVTYWWTTTLSQYFAGDHDNWIADHMRMHPDIFVGTEDYPGDDGTINGTPVIAGIVPKFRPLGTYQIDYREGYVRFPEEIDSVLTPVTANYAYLTGIRNVTGQLLTVIGGTGNTQFHASAEPVYVASHGKRWINRNDKWLPRNVYVNGVLAGVPSSVAGEFLTIKTS